MAHQRWHTLTIDLQHGVVDYAAMVTMLQAISTTQTVRVVRVPWLEPGIILKRLDTGAGASNHRCVCKTPARPDRQVG
jgi:4-hydroxy-2-oxoheptanedioate aldolase